MSRIAFFSSLVCFGLASLPSIAAALVFTVNSTGDDADQEPLDNLCWTGAFVVTSQGSELECTLRAAIEQANAFSGDDTIAFGPDLPQTANTTGFSPTTPLPVITDTLVIDGETAAGYDAGNPWATPRIVLNGPGSGSVFGPGESGLRIDLQGDDAVTIRALGIYDSQVHGVEVDLAGTSSFAIEGSHIGVWRGLFFQGNYSDGIHVTGSGGGTEVRIGPECDVSYTSCVGKGNVISANGGSGITIVEAVSEVHSNRIGTDVAGVTTFVAFGGATPNDEYGVYIYNSTFTELSRLDGNLVSGNLLGGIQLEGPPPTPVSQFLLTRNRIGTNANGTAALGNSGWGVLATITSLTMGDYSDSESGNLVSGNFAGVACVDCWLYNNTIGLNADRSAEIKNAGVGVRFNGGLTQGFLGTGVAWFNTIAGGTVADAHAIFALGEDIDLYGNHIGTTATGGDFGNLQTSGIRLGGTNQLFGGGIAPDFGRPRVALNVVGNFEKGIELAPYDFMIADTIVPFSPTYTIEIGANHIGVTPAGADIGNVGPGIEIVSGANAIVGKFSPLSSGSQNWIGFNGSGIRVEGQGVVPGSQIWIRGNYVGITETGADIGNDGAGVLIAGATNVSVGANDPSADLAEIESLGNEIAFNGGDGVELPEFSPGGEATNANAIVGNRIHSNSDEPIDLNADGATPNDLGDPDTGANGLLNTPEFDTGGAVFNETTGELDIRYRVDTPVSVTNPVLVHFYLVEDASGGEPMAYLGSTSYPASAAGAFVDFSLPLPGSLPAVSATASLAATSTTDAEGTSEMRTTPVPEPASMMGLAVGVLALLAAGVPNHRRERSCSKDSLSVGDPSGR